MEDKKWDVFISYAWEDKEFVDHLADALKKKELNVWYDRFVLTVGDSLQRKINEGLANSRYGIVVLSPYFFAKEWPQRELDGLAAKDAAGKKVILPIWHKIDKVQVSKYSLMLAGLLAVSSGRGAQRDIEHVVTELLRAMELESPASRPELSAPVIRRAEIGSVPNLILQTSTSCRAQAAIAGVLMFSIACMVLAVLSGGFPPMWFSNLMLQGTPTALLPTPVPASTPAILVASFTPTPLSSPTSEPTIAVPTLSPTPEFYILDLKDTLRVGVFGGATAFSYDNPVVIIDNRKQVPISEGRLDTAYSLRQVRIKVAVLQRNYQQGNIPYPGGGTILPIFSTINDAIIGSVFSNNPAAIPVEYVGVNAINPSLFDVVVQGWVQEQVLRMQ